LRWSTVFAAAGLIVVALGAIVYVLPFVFPNCTTAQYSVCTPSYLTPAQSVEVFFVGLALVGVALVFAVQEFEASFRPEPPVQGRI
jgi:4-amino-4-deoxy-L-arabinose transferase-like glycosyltransferase